MSEPTEEQISAAYRQLFCSGTPESQIVMRDLVARYHFQTAFVPGLEPWQPAARDAARGVIEYILKRTDAPTISETRRQIISKFNRP